MKLLANTLLKGMRRCLGGWRVELRRWNTVLAIQVHSDGCAESSIKNRCSLGDVFRGIKEIMK